MTIPDDQALSLRTLLTLFRGRISLTWSLVLIETALFALLPLLVGYAIDGLLADDWGPFCWLLAVFAGLLFIATGRRFYDTRAFGSIRVALSLALSKRAQARPVSVVNARVLMGRELVDFLEDQAPGAVMALIQVLVAIAILSTFHATLAASASLAAIATLGVHYLSAGQFFCANRRLNAQFELQVDALKTMKRRRVWLHFTHLKRQEIRMSDLESAVYGVIFLVLLSMLGFNLWFAATQSRSSTGAVFAIVTYSFTLVESSVVLPMALQSITRLQEITDRINQS